jgi:FkbM family methyltransferase
MKNLKQISVIAALGILSLTACENPETNKPKQEDRTITIFHGSVDSITGPEEEVTLLKTFPRALYKIYAINGLGSFYIDSRDDIIKNELRTGRPWESDFINLMKQYVRPGTTAIDIGAHIGTHTLSLSHFVGDKGCVVAFEPQMKLYSELVMNMILNKRDNVIAYRCALGDMFKDIEMNPSVAGNEGGTLIGKGGDTAKMITLDSLNLDNVSFIKLDVENFEYEVLSGAEQTIRRNHPYMIRLLSKLSF